MYSTPLGSARDHAYQKGFKALIISVAERMLGRNNKPVSRDGSELGQQWFFLFHYAPGTFWQGPLLGSELKKAGANN